MVGIGIGLNLRMDAVGGGAAPTTSTATQGNITFTADQGGLTTGNFAGGQAYIVLPSGTANITKSNTQTTLGGEIVNGMEKNPQAGQDDQGYDEGLITWNAAKNVGNTVEVTAGDVLVTGIAADPRPAQDRYGMFDEIATCYILSSAPTAGAFVSSALGWALRGEPATYTPNVSTLVAALNSYDTTGHDLPSYATLMSRLDLARPLFAQFSNNSSWYQNASPSDLYNGANYGEYLAGLTNAAMLALISDDFTTVQKEAIYTRLLDWGLQWFDAWDGAGLTFPTANGGHYQWHLGPMAIALHATSRTSEYADLVTNYGGNFLQYSYLTAGQAAQFAPHSSLSNAAHWRERAITAVNGLDITVETERSGTTGDLAQFVLQPGAKMVRASDGAEATITAQDHSSPAANATGSMVLTIDAQPGSPFAVSDDVHLPEDFVPAEGDPIWIINGVGDFNKFSALPNAAYRTLNRLTGLVLFLNDAGYWHSNWDAIKDYVILANTADTPDASFDYPTHHNTFVDGGTNYNWEVDFWTDHSVEILGLSTLNETTWTSSTYFDMQDEGLPVSSENGFTFALKGRFTSVTTYLAAIGFDTYLRREGATNWRMRLEDTGGVARYNNTSIAAATTNGAELALLLVVNDTANTVDLWIDGTKEVDGAALSAGGETPNNLLLPQMINAILSSGTSATDMGMFGVWVAADATTGGWSDFFDGNGDPTTDMASGSAIGGVTPDFAESGDAAAWNALTGMSGTVTDA